MNAFSFQDSDTCSSTPSNVTRIARAIKNEDQHASPQIVYYQAGVGTGLGLRDQLLGGGTGERAKRSFKAHSNKPANTTFGKQASDWMTTSVKHTSSWPTTTRLAT